MHDFFKRIENWLDKKHNKLDRQHYYLRFSKNKFHKLLWKWFFKPKRSRLDILANSASVPRISYPQGGRVIHVVNLLDPRTLKDQGSARRVSLTLDSINRADRKNAILLGCVTDNTKLKDWKIHRLKRSAKSELGSKIDFAFLKDMLIAANNIARAGDIIFYSNMDCPVHPDVYQHLLMRNEGAAEFIRRDVDDAKTYTDLFNRKFKHYSIGVDGIAIKKEAIAKLLPMMPDLIIGEPHWDTAVSGILHKNFNTIQNLDHLYHVKHEQQWDDNNLSVGGKHNKKLYRDCVNYGLMEDELISIKKDCALILLKDTKQSGNTIKLLKQLRGLPQDRLNCIFCEQTKGGSSFKRYLTGIGYLPIIPTNANVEALKQRGAIANLLINHFADHKYVIIVLNDCANLNLQEIDKIKNKLKHKPQIITKEYLAVESRHARARVFDFFLENESDYPSINQYSFINDDGLLELFSNYGHFQSLYLPEQGTQKQLGN